jgi:hypothetical protein
VIVAPGRHMTVRVPMACERIHDTASYYGSS